MQQSNPVFIAPECHVPGCRQTGDQFTMVKCRFCDQWFCADHLNSNDTIRRSSIVNTGLPGLSYYIGVCAGCSQKQAQQRRPVGSTWLR